MRKLIKTGLLLLLAFAAGNKVLAQTVNVVTDTLKVRVENKTAVDDPTREGTGTELAQQPRKAADNNPSKAIRQVQGGRPDLSKSRGARPPVIIRPAGKAIPKGVGKPAGVGKKGGR